MLERGITQEEVAKGIHTTQSAVSKLLNGREAASLKTLYYIILNYKINLNWLFNLSDEMYQKKQPFDLNFGATAENIRVVVTEKLKVILQDYTQLEIAKLLDINQGAWSKIINYKEGREIQVNHLYNLCKERNINLNWLFGLSKEMRAEASPYKTNTTT